MHSRRGRGGGYHQSKRGRGNSWVRGGGSSAVATTTTGPVLNGPKINRTWKRPENATAAATSNDVSQPQLEQTQPIKLKDSEASKIPPTEQSSAPPSGEAISTIDLKGSVVATTVQMRKVGGNKLVMKNKKPPAKIKASEPLKMSPQTQSSAPPSEAISTIDSKGPVAATSNQMRKVGGNKLVMKNKKPAVPTAMAMKRHPAGSSRDMFTATNKKTAPVEAKVSSIDMNGYQAMKAKGRNKLVSGSRLEEEERLKEALKRKRIESKRGRAKGPAKRVKLDSSNMNPTGDDIANEQYQHQDEKLTDFAYQQTSKSNRRWKNMGLVRVAGAEDAPICPTFARGLPCTNPKCQKRHDVAREAPICSFFQRNGQCLKRDTCPFRHIKVNPHAMICSSYSLLGYCEDDNCQMKHVAARRGFPSSNATR